MTEVNLRSLALCILIRINALSYSSIIFLENLVTLQWLLELIVPGKKERVGFEKPPKSGNLF